MSERINYVEIDLPKCALTYGESPCVAALGVTGDRKCYNTRATCQDIANYDEDTEVLRLSEPSLNLNPDVRSIPNIVSVDYTPSRIMLAESIGARASITITCRDHPSPDTGPGGDKYLADRDFDPFHLGTFWGKFKARQPFLRGRTLRWYNGEVGASLDNMERRTYVIDELRGPDTNGRFTIRAKDPLTLTDDERARAPRLSRGRLDSDLTTTSTTSITLEPEGIGDADYPESGFVAIGGSEICAFTRSPGSDTLSLTTRGDFNTEAAEHDEDERVQLCLRYENEDPADILHDLLTEYGNIPAAFINLPNWQVETTQFLGFVYSSIIPEPTSVEDLANEILEQTGMSMWWDELSGTLRLQVLRDIPQNSFVYTADHMLDQSFSQQEQPRKRVSQSWIYYGKINPLESLEDPSNYRVSAALVSLQSEADFGVASVKQIFSRWIVAVGRPQADRANNIIVSRFAYPPRLFRYSLLKGSGVPQPLLGSGRQIEHPLNQIDTGELERPRTQIIEVKSRASAWDVSAEEITLAPDIEPLDPTDKIVPIDSDTANFNFLDAARSIYGDAIVSGDTVTCDVRSGVVVFSTSRSAYAFETGSDWPDGVTIKLRVRDGAYIVGRGGNGGNTNVEIDGTTITVTGSAGGNGGPAMRVTHDISIINSGTIGGGGGGGAPAAGFNLTSDDTEVDIAASGGGGGAGSISGSGGSASIDDADFVNQRDASGGSSGTTSSGGSGGNASVSGASANGGNGGGLGSGGGSGSASGDEADTGTPGSGGVAIDGVSLVTYDTKGTVLGAEIN